MPNVFAIIGSAWTFFRSHSLLNSVTLWMLFLPTVAVDQIDRFSEETAFLTQNNYMVNGIEFLAIVALTVVIIWGEACILIVGRRLAGKAGKAQPSSFRSLCKDARTLILPLLLTEILFSATTLLWALLLIIPGVLYAIRASFYPVVIATSDLRYRDALTESKRVVTGQTWVTLLTLLGIGVVLFLPTFLLFGGLTASIEAFDARLAPVGSILFNGAISIGTTLYILSTLILFSELRKNKT